MESGASEIKIRNSGKVISNITVIRSGVIGETDPRGKASPPSINKQGRFANRCESQKDYSIKVLTKHIPVCYTESVNIRKAKARKKDTMTTEALKNAIYAEMLEGKSLLAARLEVQSYLLERLDVAAEELKTKLTREAEA